MVTATERYLDKHLGKHPGSIAFLITSDEEGPAINGTRKVMDTLTERGEAIDYCIVGEPSSSARLGDVARHGRRGKVVGDIHIHGVQGHVAYPHLADNPIVTFAPALNHLCDSSVWASADGGMSEHFPPTSFQISNLNAGIGVDNVIPGHLRCEFDVRYSTQLTYEQVVDVIDSILRTHCPSDKYELNCKDLGRPFLTTNQVYIDVVTDCIRKHVGEGVDTTWSTGGGTSDGRYISPAGADVIELGPVNKTIHSIDECVLVEDVDRLSLIYEDILQEMLQLPRH
eukprot:GFYU01035738.1.p1 GENE.GFYU01035738.1~~GFYU01035738.1.p1  ORF type:complete len:330 (-),score=74.92 GFYU01035738.1:63-914(-)